MIKKKSVFIFITNIKVYKLYALKLINHFKNNKEYNLTIVLNDKNHTVLKKNKLIIEKIKYLEIEFPNNFSNLNIEFRKLILSFKKYDILILPCLYPLWSQAIIYSSKCEIFYYQNGQNMNDNEAYLEHFTKIFNLKSFIVDLINIFISSILLKFYSPYIFTSVSMRFKKESYFKSIKYFKKVSKFICFEESFAKKITRLNKSILLINDIDESYMTKKFFSIKKYKICFAPTYWLPSILLKLKWKNDCIENYFAMKLETTLYSLDIDYNLSFRFHPSSNLLFWENVKNKLDIKIKNKIVNANDDNPDILNYLNQFDYVISDISSIKSASALLNIPIINYNVLEGFRK